MELFAFAGLIMVILGILGLISVLSMTTTVAILLIVFGFIVAAYFGRGRVGRL